MGERAQRARQSFNKGGTHNVRRCEDRTPRRARRAGATRSRATPRSHAPAPPTRGTTRSRRTGDLDGKLRRKDRRQAGLSGLCSAMKSPGDRRALSWSGESAVARARAGGRGPRPARPPTRSRAAPRSARARPRRRAPRAPGAHAGGDRARSPPGRRRGRAGPSRRARTATLRPVEHLEHAERRAPPRAAARPSGRAARSPVDSAASREKRVSFVRSSITSGCRVDEHPARDARCSTGSACRPACPAPSPATASKTSSSVSSSSRNTDAAFAWKIARATSTVARQQRAVRVLRAEHAGCDGCAQVASFAAADVRRGQVQHALELERRQLADACSE